MKRSVVPCNGCMACCRRESLILHPECGDDPAEYECEPVRNPLTRKIVWALKHKPDGSCIYLGEKGCTIWNRAPAICKEFDCRKFLIRLYEQTTRTERRLFFKKGLLDKVVMKAAEERLHTLKLDE